jgi:5,5'-dehydrodivanillate O-demethylase
MTSRDENERLTRVGPDTPCGRLLRRYWWPFAISVELTPSSRRKVRLLGEDLVVFRTPDGEVGLIAERCPHRGASMAYGVVEDGVLRCPYHGWCFDRTGACTEQPNEMRFRPRFREEAATTAYPVRELGGLLFAYLGPAPAPPVPPYELFMAEPGADVVLDIGLATVPCNWLQIMENSVDPTHAEWLHGVYFDRILQEAGEAPTTLSGRHVKLAFDLTDFGIVKRRLREGQSEDSDDWLRGHPLIFPNILLVGLAGFRQYQIRVPVDDVTTLHIWYTLYQLSPEVADLVQEVQGLPHTFEVPVFNDRGDFIVDDIDGQDLLVWVTQGPISDRTVEHLGASDRGVVMLRRLLGEQIDAVARGEVPMNADRRTLLAFAPEDKPIGAGLSAQNEMAAYLKTHARHSPVVRRLVELIDARRGVSVLE